MRVLVKKLSLTQAAPIQIDSTEPDAFGGVPMTAEFRNVGGPSDIYQSQAFTVLRTDLEPGEHTFTMRFWLEESDQTGTIDPVMVNASMMVVPLGFE